MKINHYISPLALLMITSCFPIFSPAQILKSTGKHLILVDSMDTAHQLSDKLFDDCYCDRYASAYDIENDSGKFFYPFQNPQGNYTLRDTNGFWHFYSPLGDEILRCEPQGRKPQFYKDDEYVIDANDTAYFYKTNGELLYK